MTEKLVEVTHLKKYFHAGRPNEVRAVDDVSFTIHRGEVFGLVGESGSGKTTVGRCLLNLYHPTAGQIHFAGQDVMALTSRQAQKEFHRRTQMIFQDPYASLDPRLTVKEIVAEGLKVHGLVTNPRELTARVADLLRQVGLTPDVMARYPYEFSGGQRQRIGVARALAVQPEFVVADEPLSALDVSVQAQIVELMEKLRAQHALTYLFIAHDLAMVKYISDRIGVMYHGRLVEVGTADEVVNHPVHPYTQSLLSAVMVPDPQAARRQKRVDYQATESTGPLKEVSAGHYAALV